MKAPRWLTESFKEGVDERELLVFDEGCAPVCWLAQFDKAQRPCEGRFERFHFIGRQRVEKAVAYLASEVRCQWIPEYNGGEIVADESVADDLLAWTADIPLLAAWDSRNGGIACEAHHRRFDSAMTPALLVPHEALPEHVAEFVADWGLEPQLETKFPEDAHV